MLNIFSGPPEFSAWSSWSFCTKRCGGGTRTISRTCTANCENLRVSDTTISSGCNKEKCELTWFSWTAKLKSWIALHIRVHLDLTVFLKIFKVRQHATMEIGFTLLHKLSMWILACGRSIKVQLLIEWFVMGLDIKHIYRILHQKWCLKT